jgi:hypothetical protein
MPELPYEHPGWPAGFEEVIRRKVPDVVTATGTDRFWVAGMIQFKGRIHAQFARQIDATYLSIDVWMTDPAPTFILSDRVGLPRPSEPIKGRGRNPRWQVRIVGLRALRVLQETLPILLGERLKEAKTAVEFFAPDGIHPDRLGDREIWSVNEFPWRVKGLDSSQSEDDEVQEVLRGLRSD